MRFPGAVLLSVLAACAGPLPEPPVLDLEDHCRLTAEGFREASPFVAERLQTVRAWAVFPEVEGGPERCAHEGMLFRRDAAPDRVHLVCSAAPASPAGETYHALVLLDDPEDLERLAEGSLDLSDVPHVGPHDDHGPLPEASTLVVTSHRGSLLFAPEPLRVEIRPEEPPPPIYR